LWTGLALVACSLNPQPALPGDGTPTGGKGGDTSINAGSNAGGSGSATAGSSSTGTAGKSSTGGASAGGAPEGGRPGTGDQGGAGGDPGEAGQNMGGQAGENIGGEAGTAGELPTLSGH
jgi:hypothetical protein